ncbi:MAG: hypothetical protein Q8R25_02215 [bacterium]|nr:hypothetical protein [bacterium]
MLKTTKSWLKSIEGNPRYFVGAVLGVALGAGVYFLFPLPPTAQATLDVTATYRDQVSYWKSRIDEEGGTKAYEEFGREVAQLSYGQKHSGAHAFGAALFAAEGARGVFVCDQRFSFGCFHQFLGDAITALGIESIPELNEQCFDALSASPLSCQHGIGHGALASIGYDDTALLKALDICKDLSGVDPIGGCYGGVFMEYNVRTMLAEDATTREYSGNQFAPCDSLASEFVPACIYWQPQWWQQIQGEVAVEEKFRVMGEYCRRFGTTQQLSRSCFEGIGNIVEQSSDFDPTRARTLCDAAGSTSKENLACRSIAANHFGIDVSHDAAAQVCGDLAGETHEFCMAYGTNRGNVANELPI